MSQASPSLPERCCCTQGGGECATGIPSSAPPVAIPARARTRVVLPPVQQLSLQNVAFKLSPLAQSVGSGFHGTERLSELTPAVVPLS